MRENAEAEEEDDGTAGDNNGDEIGDGRGEGLFEAVKWRDDADAVADDTETGTEAERANDTAEDPSNPASEGERDPPDEATPPLTPDNAAFKLEVVPLPVAEAAAAADVCPCPWP